MEKLLTVHHGLRFVRDFIPAEKDTGSSRWKIIGVVSYAAAALFAWAQIPTLRPVTQIAPDLAIQSAQFGLFETKPDGTVHFTPTTSVPLQEGSGHGWVLRLKTTRASVNLREEYFLVPPDSVDAEGASANETDLHGYDPLTISEKSETTEGGLLSSSWNMQADQPRGERPIRVYLDGVLVHTFTFTVHWRCEPPLPEQPRRFTALGPQCR